MATELYRLVLKRLGVDPYKGDKEAANKWALKVLPSAISMLGEVDDPLERFRAAVRFSLVGNAIDLGVSGYRFSLEDLERAFETVRLEVDDTVLLMKAVVEGMIVVDQLESFGCFSGKVTQRVPSLLVVQTIGLYITHSNPELQELALVLLYQLKVKCKKPKDMPEVIQQILASVILETSPSKIHPQP